MDKAQKVILRTCREVLSSMCIACAITIGLSEAYEISRWILIPLGLVYGGFSFYVMFGIVNAHKTRVEDWESVNFCAQILSLLIPIFLACLSPMYLDEFFKFLGKKIFGEKKKVKC